MKITKKYLSKDLNKVIDTEFKQLVKPQETTSFSLDDFFALYEDLFYQIPKMGDTNSHEYLIKKSSEYVGASSTNDEVQALLEEITSLRQENLDLQKSIITLSTPKV